MAVLWAVLLADLRVKIGPVEVEKKASLADVVSDFLARNEPLLLWLLVFFVVIVALALLFWGTGRLFPKEKDR